MMVEGRSSPGLNNEKIEKDKRIRRYNTCRYLVSPSVEVNQSIEQSGLEPWPGSLCCVLGQDTLLS